MEKFIVSINNCGEVENKFISTEKLSDIQKLYLLECINNPEMINYLNNANICKINKKEKLLKLSDEKIEALFKYMFTGGFGYQWGNPGKEWVTIDIKNLKDCNFEKLKKL